MGKHYGLWTDEIKDPDEVLSQILGIPKALLPAKLDEPDAIDADVEDVSNNSEKRCLTLAGKSTELPAQMALDANQEAQHDLEERPESELPQPDMSESKKGREWAEELNTLNQQFTDGQRLERQGSATYETRPPEFSVSNPLTPEEIEALRRDKKAAVEYGLKAFRKLDSEKPK